MKKRMDICPPVENVTRTFAPQSLFLVWMFAPAPSAYFAGEHLPLTAYFWYGRLPPSHCLIHPAFHIFILSVHSQEEHLYQLLINCYKMSCDYTLTLTAR